MTAGHVPQDPRHESPCVDCGAMVPTLRTGQGWRDLPPCPKSTSKHYPGHRVSNDAFEAAGGRP